MAMPLLSSQDLKHFQPLGAVGIPVYTVAGQVRATVARQLGGDHADLLAVPQLNETGTRIDWYAPVEGVVVPWSAAGEDERRDARRRLDATLTVLAESAAALEATGTGERRIFARQLALAGSFPDESCLYLVGGHPVLTFWGFAPLGSPAEPAALQPPPPPPPIPPAAVAPAAAIAPVTPPRRRGCLWLLPLLLVLVLLALLFLKGCQRCSGLPLLDPGRPQQVMLVLDTSNSMRLPMSLEHGKARAILDALAKGDLNAQTVLEGFEAFNTKDRRIDVAKTALTKVVERLPSQVKLGVVIFGTCGGVVSLGDSDHFSRAQMVQSIRGIEPRAGTPLASGIDTAAFLVDGVQRPATLVVISDGEESCHGDPCATARRLKAAKPKLTIDVIDVTGDGAAACVATETGGRVIAPTKVEEFESAVLSAAEGGCP